MEFLSRFQLTSHTLDYKIPYLNEGSIRERGIIPLGLPRPLPEGTFGAEGLPDLVWPLGRPRPLLTAATGESGASSESMLVLTSFFYVFLTFKYKYSFFLAYFVDDAKQFKVRASVLVECSADGRLSKSHTLRISF